LEEYCGTCPIPFAKPIALDGGPPLDGKMRRQATYDSSLLRTGHKYFFKVRSRTSWWADSDDSNVITFVWFEPAVAPTNLVGAAADSQVTLSWQPATLKAGSDPEMGLVYQVLRSVSGGDFVKIGEPQQAASYIDRLVINGQQYVYVVQTLTTYRGELAEGGVSKEVAVTPVDLTPPPVLTGVAAVKTDEGIKIFWDKSDTADLGGYRIYRRTADQDRYELLAEVKPQFTLFVDAKAKDGVRYYYAITAIDQATPANESEKSREATVR
jgi:fibronectin type 3 domain-containing protein